jgi:uncharacterized protein
MSVDGRAISHIANALFNLELEHNIHVLFAVESGSRMWGFHSEDSDYDVRFIYIKPPESYLSIFPVRDVIETPIHYDEFLSADFDMNGWDIKKALRLATESNRALIEWVQSPIVYKRSEGFEDFKSYVLKHADLHGLYKHYSGWSRNIWNRDYTTVKNYCYALRTALAADYIHTHSKIPPVNINDLAIACYISDELKNAIEDLVRLKLTGCENDSAQVQEIFDEYIQEAISRDVSHIKQQEASVELDELNNLFHRLIGFQS